MGYNSYSSTRGRKRTYRKTKKAWYNKKYSALDMAKKAMRNVHYIKGMINCEKKYSDYQSTTTPNWSGTEYGISGIIPQGDTAGSRDGDSILLRSILVNFEIFKNSAVANQTVRIIVVLDTNKTSTLPVLTDILASTGTDAVVLSPYKTSMDGRFKILRDRTFSLNTGSTDSILRKEYIKTYVHPKYAGAFPSKDQIHIFICSDSNINLPEVKMYTRLGFYDN